MTIGDGKQILILHVGAKSFPCPLKIFQLKKVFYVPHLLVNLINVSKFFTNNIFFEFHLQFFFLKD